LDEKLGGAFWRKGAIGTAQHNDFHFRRQIAA
jgi:hypothetical protein